MSLVNETDIDVKPCQVQSQEDSGKLENGQFLDSVHQPIEFPPMPIDNKLSHKIISDFCENLTPDALEEAGCAICGQLVPVTQLTRLKAVKNIHHMLHASGVT
jgi:hypothetical protein